MDILHEGYQDETCVHEHVQKEPKVETLTIDAKHLFQNETQWNRFDAVCTPASSSSASSAGASSLTGS